MEAMAIENLPGAALAAGATAALTIVVYWMSSSKKKPAKPPILTVHVMTAQAPDPDGSPACVKLLTFLRMIGVEHEVKTLKDHQMQGSPTRKFPFVFGGQFDKPKSDSELIMDELKKDPKVAAMDSHLSAEDHAVGTAFRVMLEESSYFHVLYCRWQCSEPTGNSKLTFKAYFEPLFPFSYQQNRLLFCKKRDCRIVARTGNRQTSRARDLPKECEGDRCNFSVPRKEEIFLRG